MHEDEDGRASKKGNRYLAMRLLVYVARVLEPAPLLCTRHDRVLQYPVQCKTRKARQVTL